MRQRNTKGCGFAYPPSDGSRERETIERFADFLREAGPAATSADRQGGRTRPRSPAQRYRVRFLAWRIGR